MWGQGRSKLKFWNQKGLGLDFHSTTSNLFLHLRNTDNNTNNKGLVWKIDELTNVKCLANCLARRSFSKCYYDQSQVCENIVSLTCIWADVNCWCCQVLSRPIPHHFQHWSIQNTYISTYILKLDRFQWTSDFNQISTCTGPIPHRDGRLSFHQPQEQCTRLQTLLSSRLEQLSGHLQQRHFSAVILEIELHISIMSGHHPDKFLPDYDLNARTSPSITVFSHRALHAFHSSTPFQLLPLHRLKTHTFLFFFSLPFIDSWILFCLYWKIWVLAQDLLHMVSWNMSVRENK